MLLFGGRDDSGLHNDTLAIDLASLVWARLGDDDPRGIERPLPRAETGLVHLADDRFAIFGGETLTELVADVWEFDTGTRVWKALAPGP